MSLKYYCKGTVRKHLKIHQTIADSRQRPNAQKHEKGLGNRRRFPNTAVFFDTGIRRLSLVRHERQRWRRTADYCVGIWPLLCLTIGVMPEVAATSDCVSVSTEACCGVWADCCIHNAVSSSPLCSGQKSSFSLLSVSTVFFVQLQSIEQSSPSPAGRLAENAVCLSELLALKFRAFLTLRVLTTRISFALACMSSPLQFRCVSISAFRPIYTFFSSTGMFDCNKVIIRHKYTKILINTQNSVSISTCIWQNYTVSGKKE